MELHFPHAAEAGEVGDGFDKDPSTELALVLTHNALDMAREQVPKVSPVKRHVTSTLPGF